MTTNDGLIGRNLAELRGNISQQELGEKMRERGFKWSQATVWEVEKGKRPLRLAEAIEVMDILGKSDIQFSSLWASGSELTLRAKLDRVIEARKRFDSALAEYQDSLDELSMNAAIILEQGGHEGVPNYLWWTTRAWIEDDNPVEVVLRRLAERRAPNGDEIRDSMADLGVTTIADLVKHRDELARAKGYESYEDMQAAIVRTYNVVSYVRENLEGPDNGVDQETT